MEAGLPSIEGKVPVRGPPHHALRAGAGGLTAPALSAWDVPRAGQPDLALGTRDGPSDHTVGDDRPYTKRKGISGLRLKGGRGSEPRLWRAGRVGRGRPLALAGAGPTGPAHQPTAVSLPTTGLPRTGPTLPRHFRRVWRFLGPRGTHRSASVSSDYFCPGGGGERRVKTNESATSNSSLSLRTWINALHSTQERWKWKTPEECGVPLSTFSTVSSRHTSDTSFSFGFLDLTSGTRRRSCI